MRFQLVCLFLAILTLVVAKHDPPPPKPKPDPGACGKSKTCNDCCGKHVACLQVR